MVKLNRIYTRTGDAGTTGLVDGSRVSKADARMAAIGDVDEANSAIGIARTALEGGAVASELARTALEGGAVASELARIQNDLFDLGADLATPGDIPGALRVTPAQVERLEQAIDALNADLEPLTSFILPGGTPAAAHLHLARAIVRRAERAAVALAEHADVGAAALAYVNRLSDYLFVAGRYVNQKGAGDVLWVPGGS